MFKRLTAFLLVTLSLLAGALGGCTSPADEPAPPETTAAELGGGYSLATLVAALQGYGVEYDPALGTPTWSAAQLQITDQGPVVIVPLAEGDALRGLAALGTQGPRGGWTFDVVIADLGIDGEAGEFYPTGAVDNLDGTNRMMVEGDDEIEEGGDGGGFCWPCYLRCVRVAKWACLFTVTGYGACLTAARAACAALHLFP